MTYLLIKTKATQLINQIDYIYEHINFIYDTDPA